MSFLVEVTAKANASPALFECESYSFTEDNAFLCLKSEDEETFLVLFNIVYFTITEQ